MLTPETALQVLQWSDGHRTHHFWESSISDFSNCAMDLIGNQEGWVRMWIEEDWKYGYKWRTVAGEYLDTKPTPVKLSPINIELERKLLATRDGRTSGDFNTLLEATEWAPLLPFDHFVKKMQWILDK